MKAQEIRDLSEKERDEKATDLGQEIFNLGFQLATGKIENPSRLKSLRRDIARIKTIQREVGKGAPKSVEEIKKALERDNFMTAETAKSFGLIDEVVEKRS